MNKAETKLLQERDSEIFYFPSTGSDSVDSLI